MQNAAGHRMLDAGGAGKAERQPVHRTHGHEGERLGLDQVEVYRKPAAAGIVEEERRKVGEISVKSAKLEVTITFE